MAEATETAVVWSDTPVTTTVAVEPITLAQEGEPVGTVGVSVGSTSVTVPLVLDEDITDPGPYWRWTHPGEL